MYVCMFVCMYVCMYHNPRAPPDPPKLCAGALQNTCTEHNHPKDSLKVKAQRSVMQDSAGAAQRLTTPTSWQTVGNLRAEGVPPAGTSLCESKGPEVWP